MQVNLDLHPNQFIVSLKGEMKLLIFVFLTNVMTVSCAQAMTQNLDRDCENEIVSYLIVLANMDPTVSEILVDKASELINMGKPLCEVSDLLIFDDGNLITTPLQEIF